MDPFWHIVDHEEQFDRTVSLNMHVMNLERSGKIRIRGLEHQDWDRGSRNLVVPWATFRDSVSVFALQLNW